MIPTEVRSPYDLLSYQNAWTWRIIARRMLLVPNEVACLNRFFCLTGQLKRYIKAKAVEEVSEDTCPACHRTLPQKGNP